MTGDDLSVEDAAELAVIQAELRRRNLADYIAACYPMLELSPWQIDLCVRLQRFVEDIEDGKGPRLMVFAPPQCGKSTIVARAFIAWVIGRHPEWAGIVASYAASLAKKHGRWIRNQVDSGVHSGVFPASKLSRDSAAADDMATTAGGQLIARGVGGGTTGNPAMYCIIDDPFADRQQADSKIIRDNVDDWYTAVVTTRIGPGGGVLIMHTRWHMDDLAGRLQERTKDGGDAWQVASYPAINPDGSALPCRFSLDEFQRKRANMPPRDWLALYQQTPVADGGSYFDRQWLTEWQTMPEGCQVYMACDFAISTKEEADYTVILPFGVGPDRVLYLMNPVRAHLTANGIIKAMHEQASKHKPMELIVEKGQIWLALEEAWAESCQERKRWYSVREVVPITDKATRARSIQGLLEMGRVRFPPGTFTRDTWWPEILAFPVGKNDDLVDAMAYAGLHVADLLTGPGPKEPPPGDAQPRAVVPLAARAKEAERRAGATRGPIRHALVR